MKFIKLTQDTNIKMVTIALWIAVVLSAIEGTVVATATPSIVASFHDVYGVNWIFSVYLLTSTIMTPIYGKLADQFGRKLILLSGLVIFIISSVLLGLANSMTTLIIERAFQGIGAGAILPIANTIIADMYSFSNRATVMGVNNSIWGVTSVIAPLLGGFIVDNFGWQFIFWVNVPFTLLIIILVSYGLHERKIKQNNIIDYLGILYLTIIVSSMMWIIDTLGKRKIDLQVISWNIIIIIVVGVIFARRENSFSEPLIPMHLFKSTTFVTQNLIMFLISGYLIALNVYLPDWIQGLLGYHAIFSGFAMAPISLLWIFGSFISGFLLTKIYAKKITNIGLIFMIIGSASMTLVSQQSTIFSLIIISAINGLGLGMIITNATVAVQNEVDAKNIGVATSFNTLCRNMGQILFITIFGIIMNTSLRIGSLQTDHPKRTLRLMSKLINPKTAQSLSNKMVEQLHEILFSGLHNVFVIGLALIVAIYLINFFDVKKRRKD